MDDMPLHITRIRMLDENYEVLYSGTWLFINSIEQIKDMAWNYSDVEEILKESDRWKKINKIMKLDNKIYNNKVIYQKNDY